MVATANELQKKTPLPRGLFSFCPQQFPDSSPTIRLHFPRSCVRVYRGIFRLTLVAFLVVASALLRLRSDVGKPCRVREPSELQRLDRPSICRKSPSRKKCDLRAVCGQVVVNTYTQAQKRNTTQILVLLVAFPCVSVCAFVRVGVNFAVFQTKTKKAGKSPAEKIKAVKSKI